MISTSLLGLGLDPFELTSEEKGAFYTQYDPSAKGLKYDENKSRIDLVDPEFLEGLGNVLGFGAQKYSAHNWRNGIAYSRLIAAAYRHLGAIQKGEDVDPESGLPHALHAGCCIQFLYWMMMHRPEFDDRYKKE